MKKVQSKKLTLGKMTVAKLTFNQMQYLAGGYATTDNKPPSSKLATDDVSCTVTATIRTEPVILN
jgi:hypothetical protein